MTVAFLPALPGAPWPAGAAAAQRGPEGTGGAEHGHGAHPHRPPHLLPRAAPSSCAPSPQSSCPPAPGAGDYDPCSAGPWSSPRLPAPASVPGRRLGWTWAVVGGQVVPGPQALRRAGRHHWLRGAVFGGATPRVLGAGVWAALPLSMCCPTPLRTRSPSPGHAPWGPPRLHSCLLSPQLLPPLPPHHRPSLLPMHLRP